MQHCRKSKLAWEAIMHKAHVAFTEILGQVIRKHRQDKEITQDIIAPKAALTASSLSRIESGQTPITVLQLRKLGDTLGVPGWQLLRKAEELAADIVKASPGVRIVDERPKTNQPEATGWFLGGAAVGALLASLLSGSERSGEKPADRTKTRARK